MTLPWYCTREDVKGALDVAETARADAQIDRLIGASSRSIEGLTHRRFYPEIDTRELLWPDDQMGRAWRLWLNQHELISVTSLVSGGVTITDYFLEPNGSGPPYNRIEINLSGPSSFSAAATYQRSVAITGVFGYSADTAPAGLVAEALDATETGVDVTDSSAAGVGDLVLVDVERMQVTGKRMAATGQTLQSPIAAQKNAEVLAVADGTAFAAGETLLLDAERMLVVDVAGNSLIVKRAYDGSTLASHTGSTVYAPRTLVVERGVLGTTAATHSIGSTVYRHVVPGLVRSLAVAETLSALLGDEAGWSHGVGRGDRVVPGDRRALDTLRDQVWTRHGRKLRSGVV